MNKLIILLGISFLLVGSVSAISGDFYFSDSCQHCNEVKPFMNELSKYFTINFLNVAQGNYNIPGVPLLIIKTNDGREISLSGSQEIPRYSVCEFQEQSNLNCPTYSANECRIGSWFVR